MKDYKKPCYFEETPTIYTFVLEQNSLNNKNKQILLDAIHTKLSCKYENITLIGDFNLTVN